MTRFFSQKTIVVISLLLSCFFFSLGSAVAAVEIVEINFGDGKWMNQSDSLNLKLNRLVKPEEGRLAIFVGQTDVTSQVESTGTELQYIPSIVPLPVGNSEITVFIVSDSQEWTELARLPLQVLTKTGFEETEITPTLDVALKSQFVEDRTDDAGAATRSQPYVDVSFQAGLTSRHSKGDFSIQTQANFLGVSLKEEALRFGQEAERAPRIDLSGYLVVIQKGSALFSFGDNNYGSGHNLLGVENNRGVHLKYNAGRFDLSLGSMNGTSIVGWENPVGLSDFNNNISTAAVGMEIFEDRPGDLRVEVMYLDGSVQAEGNFNQGEILDAERSHGVGLHLKVNNIMDRIRADFQFARSTFVNGEDVELALGTGGLSSVAVTENARDWEIGVQLIKGLEFSKNKFFSLTATVHHSRIDPLYKSVGAFTSSDQLTNWLLVNSEVAGTQIFYKYTQSEDNVDDVASILKTKNRTHSVNYSFPVQSLFSDLASPNKWLPNLSYSFFHNHQFGVGNDALASNGFDSTQIPNQFQWTHAGEASWTGDRWNFSYRFNQAFQDNAQPGRTGSDFKEISNEFALSMQPLDALSVDLSVSRIEQDDLENALVRFTNNLNFGFNWAFMELWNLSGNYSLTGEGDDQVSSSSASLSTNTQLSRQFEFTLPGGRNLPGRIFAGHNLQSNNNTDNVFDSKAYARTWTVNGGLSFTLF